MNIKMGNDEFILYVRKNFPECQIANAQLGKKIWNWLKENNPSAEIAEPDKPCLWSNSDEITSDISLPKTATQFQFSIEILPQLYSFLNELGKKV